MKHLFAILVLTFLGSAAFAQIKNPLIFRAQKDDKVIYIFGTTHFGMSINELPGDFFQIVDSSANFFVEADPNLITKEQFKKMATYANGHTLDQYLPANSWEKLVALTGYDPEKLRKYKPWYAGLLFQQIDPSLITNHGSVDYELRAYVQAQGKTIGYLETPLVQFAAIEATTPVEKLNELLVRPDPKAYITEMFFKMLNCYRDSDIECLTQLTGTIEMGGLMEPWQREILVTQRNRSWMQIIESAAAEGQTFIAVGAVHVVGEDSLVRLLEDKGYTIGWAQF